MEHDWLRTSALSNNRHLRWRKTVFLQSNVTSVIDETKTKLLEKNSIQSNLYSKNLGLVATEFLNVSLHPTKTELMVVQKLNSGFEPRYKGQY